MCVRAEFTQRYTKINAKSKSAKIQKFLFIESMNGPFDFFPDPIRVLSLLALTLAISLSILSLTRASFKVTTPTRIKMNSLSSFSATLASIFHIVLVSRRYSLQEHLIMTLSPPDLDVGVLFLATITHSLTWICLVSLLIQILFTIQGVFKPEAKMAVLSVKIFVGLFTVLGVYGTIASVFFLHQQLWYILHNNLPRRNAVPVLDEYNESTVDIIGKVTPSCVATVFVTYGFVMLSSFAVGPVLIHKLFRGTYSMNPLSYIQVQTDPFALLQSFYQSCKYLSSRL